ncbi:hypothetical protein BDK51DRAFT_34088 [Blyttiomyces helicus]|uniref:Uncharacterized protein n=1 Tax=Blyttiomyces helicus TaxID=388810 RepID=A0A4P9WPG0_9FUNG|nr:hypothetical protein BDK51DRAFT_34088 [Blyttiomyces helicus]|eukprot:RKO94013.1 hypothetical protein BDK51DRAFT_34088 [Blyttiomyces helicus]
MTHWTCLGLTPIDLYKLRQHGLILETNFGPGLLNFAFGHMTLGRQGNAGLKKIGPFTQSDKPSGAFINIHLWDRNHVGFLKSHKFLQAAPPQGLPHPPLGLCYKKRTSYSIAKLASTTRTSNVSPSPNLTPSAPMVLASSIGGSNRTAPGVHAWTFPGVEAVKIVWLLLRINKPFWKLSAGNGDSRSPPHGFGVWHLPFLNSGVLRLKPWGFQGCVTTERVPVNILLECEVLVTCSHDKLIGVPLAPWEPTTYNMAFLHYVVVVSGCRESIALHITPLTRGQRAAYLPWVALALFAPDPSPRFKTDHGNNTTVVYDEHGDGLEAWETACSNLKKYFIAISIFKVTQLGSPTTATARGFLKQLAG